MNTYYTDEKHTQMLISLMREHAVRRIVVSPGTTNVCFVASVQQDPYFEIFSAADERSAAYIACGMAAESGEPVALSCTGATASRNYIPGLTEAYYRKLPILAITSGPHSGHIGQNFPQMLDRTVQLNDMVKTSVHIAPIYCAEDEWDRNVKINHALLELRRNGGGPVHIDLESVFSTDYSVKELPKVRVIKRITGNDEFPDIQGKVAVYVGSHQKWKKELTLLVERFCELYNAVVLCDQTSNYKGLYGILPNLIYSQKQFVSENKSFDLIIDIGDISGAYMDVRAKNVWRVNPDGEIRDHFKTTENVFEMEEIEFFKYYTSKEIAKKGVSLYEDLKSEYYSIFNMIPELPFSNVWIAQHSKDLMPANSVLHLGILNSLRAWNFFEIDPSILGYSNTGGFGIDGNISSLIGASLVNPDKIYFGVVGDLAFFYDMNSIGNRHVGKNIRIMLINNGRGTEFRNYGHPASRFGEDADKFMAAAGHYGNKSVELVKGYSESLGFLYLTADSKENFIENAKIFYDPNRTEKPILFEVFTDSADESEALRIIKNLKNNASGKIKAIVKNALGEKGQKSVKKILGK